MNVLLRITVMPAAPAPPLIPEVTGILTVASKIEVSRTVCYTGVTVQHHRLGMLRNSGAFRQSLSRPETSFGRNCPAARAQVILLQFLKLHTGRTKFIACNEFHQLP